MAHIGILAYGHMVIVSRAYGFMHWFINVINLKPGFQAQNLSQAILNFIHSELEIFSVKLWKSSRLLDWTFIIHIE